MNSSTLRPAGLNYLADNILQKDNILGTSKEEGARWARGLKLPRSGDVLFFAGCGYQFDTKLENMMGLIRKMDKSALGTDLAMGVAGLQKKLGLGGIFLKTLGGSQEDGRPLQDAIKIMRKLGLEPGYLAEDEPCCGGLLHYMGAEKDFVSHGEKVLRNPGMAKIKMVVSIVPSCTNTLRNLFQAKPDTKVLHFSQFLAEQIGNLKLDLHRNVKVTYHDPCQLVRFMGISEEPRRILGAIKGVELVEPKWVSGQYATCCGGGGGFEAVFPEMSEMLAAKRAKELAETGAAMIVTECPGCILQLKTGLKAIGAKGIEVLDLAEVVASSLEG